MKPKVFVTRKIPEKGLSLLRKHCQVRVYNQERIIPRKELIKGVKWCDALLSLLTDKIDQSLIDLNPRLKVISNYTVGYDNVDVKYATQKGIPVTNTASSSDNAVAEHVFALLFALARNLRQADIFTRAGKYQGWNPYLFLGEQLTGKTMGIIGLGRIGSGVAKRARGLGLKVIYHDIRRSFEVEKECSARFCSRENILQTADVISLHVPLFPSTRHLIGQKELAMMKKTAYLINTSRGPVVDEQALVQALKKKQIAGAGLDVYEFEPKISPLLLKLNNVILTPHTASATLEAREAMSLIAAQNILEVLQGRRAKFTVNPEVYLKK